MFRTFRSLALAGLLAVAGVALLPGAALAQYREFTGRIDKIDSKKVIVDNRQGDKVSFNYLAENAVEGQGKTKWEELKKGDWVTVSWKMADKPRKAYKVSVMPPREEAGSEE